MEKEGGENQSEITLDLRYATKLALNTSEIFTYRTSKKG
jgi:DNA-binding XRE family transcriptional regulator